MNIGAAVRSAWRALIANTLRSILTMLGIIIGVAAVITMIAVGQGATLRVQEQMKSLGSNIMMVFSGGGSQGGARQAAQSRMRLTEEDAQAIALEVDHVQVAAPMLRSGGQVIFGNANWSTTIYGVNNDYLEARDWPLLSGRLFDAAELAGSGADCRQRASGHDCAARLQYAGGPSAAGDRGSAGSSGSIGGFSGADRPGCHRSRDRHHFQRSE